MLHSYAVINDPQQILAFYERLRLQNGWNHKTLCQNLGVSYRTYCDWRAGKSLPRVVLVEISAGDPLPDGTAQVTVLYDAD